MKAKFTITLLLGIAFAVSASAVIPQHIRLARRLSRKALAVVPRYESGNTTYQTAEGATIVAKGCPCGDPQGTRTSFITSSNYGERN